MLVLLNPCCDVDCDKGIRSWEVYETIGIGIPNPRPVVKWTGPPEDLERLLAVMLQSGMDVDGLTEEERRKYLNMEVDI